MTAEKKSKVKRIVLWVAAAVVCLLLVFVLIRWTGSIRTRQKRDELSRAIKMLVEQEGQLGLFELAGIPVDYIYGDNDGYLVFENGLTDGMYSGFELQNMYVYDQCASSVVYVRVYESSSDKLTYGKQLNSGSGMIYSSDGYILTCAHVIEGGAVFVVTFADDTTEEATLVGFDRENDIAVLKAGDLRGFPPVVLDTKSDLKVGQRVFALGNPLGFTRTLSGGYISGLSRPLRNSSGRIVTGMIQTDLSINAGNSGCPLISTDAAVVGMVFSTYSESGSFESMSFAVPASTVKNIADSIISTGSVSRGWLDLVALSLTDPIVEYLGLGIRNGLMVTQVVPNGYAAKAGLRAGTQLVKYGNGSIYLGGDIITAIDGYQILDASDVYTALMNTSAGDRVTLTVYRNGELFNVQVQLVARTDENQLWLLR